MAYSNEIKKQAIELYKQNLTQQECANRLGINRRAVSDWVNKADIARPIGYLRRGKHFSTDTEFKKGDTPWIKGKTGFVPPNKGKKASIETRRKISQAVMGRKAWNKGTHIQTNTGRTHFKKGIIPWCTGKKNPHFAGDKNPRWKGGITSENARIRFSPEYKQWRRDVFVRDRFTCLECGHKYIQIVAHHIKSFADYPAMRFDIKNGITLCRSCHAKKHNHVGRFQSVAV